MTEKTLDKRAEENLTNRIANIKASSDRARWPFSLYTLLGFVVAATIYSERASWTKHWIDGIDRSRFLSVSTDSDHVCPCSSKRIKRYHPALYHVHLENGGISRCHWDGGREKATKKVVPENDGCVIDSFAFVQTQHDDTSSHQVPRGSIATSSPPTPNALPATETPPSPSASGSVTTESPLTTQKKYCDKIATCSAELSGHVAQADQCLKALDDEYMWVNKLFIDSQFASIPFVNRPVSSSDLGVLGGGAVVLLGAMLLAFLRRERRSLEALITRENPERDDLKELIQSTSVALEYNLRINCQTVTPPQMVSAHNAIADSFVFITSNPNRWISQLVFAVFFFPPVAIAYVSALDFADSYHWNHGLHGDIHALLGLLFSLIGILTISVAWYQVRRTRYLLQGLRQLVRRIELLSQKTKIDSWLDLSEHRHQVAGLKDIKQTSSDVIICLCDYTPERIREEQNYQRTGMLIAAGCCICGTLLGWSTRTPTTASLDAMLKSSAFIAGVGAVVIFLLLPLKRLYGGICALFYGACYIAAFMVAGAYGPVFMCIFCSMFSMSYAFTRHDERTNACPA